MARKKTAKKIVEFTDSKLPFKPTMEMRAYFRARELKRIAWYKSKFVQLKQDNSSLSKKYNDLWDKVNKMKQAYIKNYNKFTDPGYFD